MQGFDSFRVTLTEEYEVTVLFLIYTPPKNNSKARGRLVLERKQLRIGLKGTYIGGGGGGGGGLI